MKDQLQSVQILRAVAALAVVAFHFGQPLVDDFALLPSNPLPMGSDGVDIFFVISGFIMAYTTAGVDQRSPGQFAWKRLARIVPLYWVLTLALFALSAVAPELLSTGSASLADLGKSLAFIPYVRDDGMAVPILFLGWTLNYEMFFYAVFTIALLLAPRFRLQAVIGAMVALVAVGAAFRDQLDFLGRFYTDGLILEFVWGCLIFVAFDRWKGLLRALSWLWIVGVGLLVFQNFWDVPLPREIEKGLPAAMIVASVIAIELKDGPISRFFQRIGDASYSLYLGHPYAVEFCARLAVGLFGATVLGAIAGGAMSLVLAIGAAILSFHLLERPTNTWLRRFFRPKRTKNLASA